MPTAPVSETNPANDFVDVSTHAHGCGCHACQDNKVDTNEGAGALDSGDPGERAGAVGETPGTAGFLPVGGSVRGLIDFGGDTDLFRVDLQAGQTYAFTMNGSSVDGGTLSDPYLALFSAGNLFTPIRVDDDGGPGLNSLLTFTPNSSGTYYISAEAYSQFQTGTYTLSVTASQSTGLPAPVDDWVDSPNFSSPALDSISWDTRFNHNNITVYFAGAGETADGVTSEGFTAYERARFDAAFDLIEEVTNLRFTVVNSAANVDMQLVLDTNEIDFLGYFNPPGTSSFGSVAGVGVFAGDDWDRSPGGDLEAGGYGFQTIVHELLHGLGLAHPHDRGGDSIRLPGVPFDEPFDYYGNFDLNQGVYTTMSYNRGLQTGAPGTAPGGGGSTWGVQSGPMALDIAVLQALYGANQSHNTGNDNYYLDSTNGASTYWTSIWDAGGVDAIHHTGAGAATIDLRAATLQLEEGGGGFLSQVNGIAGGFTIAGGAVIENAFGGGAHDRIIGNDADNMLVGNNGFDTIFGGDGNDFINGGAGGDSIRGDVGDDRIFGGIGSDQLFGGLGDDRLVGGGNSGTVRDRLFGGFGDDSLFGQDGFDLLHGDAGDDYINGGAQADNIFGGTGNDTLVGEAGLDRLFGDVGDDVGFGGDGNDGLFGSQGNDTLYGQAGDDRFFGGIGNDHLFGNLGNDTMRGGAGFDRVDGGVGNDFLFGNFNADTFVFSNGHGNDTIADFDANNRFERLDFSNLNVLNSVADVLDAGTQVGVNYLIQTGAGNSVLLRGVNEAHLDASDFIF